MKTIEFLKRAFITRKCVICKDVIDYERKESLCDDCLSEWIKYSDTLCKKCGYDVDNCNCKPSSFSRMKEDVAVTYCVFYNSDGKSPVNTLIYRLKRDHNFEVIDFCADRMRNKLIKLCKKRNINIRDYVVTYPERRKAGVRKYGYDHTKLLAKSFAKKIGAKVEKCFENVGKKEQKVLSKYERYVNASSSYAIDENAEIKGKNFIIIDDIITTGSTVKVCYQLLKSEGAKNIIVVAFGKDN